MFFREIILQKVLTVFPDLGRQSGIMKRVTATKPAASKNCWLWCCLVPLIAIARTADEFLFPQWWRRNFSHINYLIIWIWTFIWGTQQKGFSLWSQVEMKEIPTTYMQKSVRRQWSLSPLRLFKPNGTTLHLTLKLACSEQELALTWILSNLNYTQVLILIFYRNLANQGKNKLNIIYTFLICFICGKDYLHFI